MAKRKTDKEILKEYCKAMRMSYPLKPKCVNDFFLRGIARAREEEPRINHGLHFADWMNICDEDDDFDSFYGEDYPWDV